ncbi:MAG: hypothetical protein ACD_73C00352G0001 [uncultured bacterium]|nr:MAG: hypothetical protein ACD_73C00352G0001 [uncultured bacterium]
MKKIIFVSVLCLFCSEGKPLAAANNNSLTTVQTIATTPNINSKRSTSVQMQPPQTSPTPYWAPDIRRLTLESTYILIGEVVDLQPLIEHVDWLQKPIVITQTTIKVDENWKGQVGNTIEFSILGGCVGSFCVDASHQPSFERGERVLLFLYKNNKGYFQICEDEAGKINLDGRYIQPEKGIIEIMDYQIKEVVENSIREGGKL